MAFRPRRTALYMPGSNARALEKARSIDVDVLLLDLEDSVAPDKKDEAREQVADAVMSGGFGYREVVVRMNGMDTQWGEADLETIIKAKPDAVLVPKVGSAEDVYVIGRKLNDAGAEQDLKIWAMMETPGAMLRAAEIAGATMEYHGRRLSCFVMGTNDLAKESRARMVPGRAPMMPWLMQCLAAARAYDLDILDGVYNNFSDLEGFVAECEQGAEMGMDGKTVIHPKQAADCNRIFSPDEAEIEWSREVITAFDAPENLSKNVMTINGKMVERLHADMARRVVQIAEAITKRDEQ
ncbi:citrate lyase subunit beta / citryl-CoA lyase [Cohaesibacter sp. ES.047]|uniref:HpcH/HpaI aldolase/citrate lyase family protein n=1 Tax=Cohaesibacter sp. ES.047 TaxID=1798205 RepID=UPI000BC0547D|nr:CoA ester lyase [Cohaesibacter sp. ES.047]SNY90649.1 citrate lyase subunit beta / citryl-CoA lyase [Cohaesibacter sp. ES.047]